MRAAARTVLVLAVALLLGACSASLPTGRPRGDFRHAPPTSFATAVSRGLPVAVGVYGVGLKGGDDPGGPAQTGEPAKRRPRSDAPADPAETAARASIGSGFILDDSGLVVTAGHVVVDADHIVVQLDDQQVLRAQLIGHDEETDIALLRVALPRPISPVLGQSVALRAGDWVLAVGQPYGLNRSVVAGIVGGTDRHFLEDPDILFIQTDLALNPGNSGGPLLDMSGAIIGMNLRVVVGGFGSPGVGLAIPIEVVVQIAHELQGHGAIERPRLGARFEDVSAPMALMAGRAYASGALVKAVSRNSLASTLQLRVGDIVVGMNGEPVGDSADLVRMLLALRSAQGTTVTVFRDGRYQRLTLE